MREMLQGDGLSDLRFERVAGWANRKPAENNPMSVRNNRLEIILLRNDVAAVGK